MRRFRVVFAAATALSASLVLAAGASAAGSLLQISADPFHNAPPGQHATEVEPDTASWGSTWISAFQVGRIFGGGSTDIGFAVSHDGGHTFFHGLLPATTINSTPRGPYSAASDPSVAYDAKHGVWLISYLGLAQHDGSAVNVALSRSTDGGNTWSAPVFIRATDHFFDKNWTTCDNTPTSPFYGHCYTEFDDVNLGDLEMVSTSDNGGLTWAPPKTTADQVHGLGGQPVVQPNGTVIVPFEGFNDTSDLVKSFMSTDGGASWSASTVVSPIAQHITAGDLRAPTLPSARIDASGRVYVVWSDCRFEPDCTGPFNTHSENDLVLSTSTDGMTWSSPARIPLDPAGGRADHFLPGLGVDPATAGSTARLGLVYYYYPNGRCTSSTCELDVGFSSSSDGGTTWTAGSRIAGPMTLTWLPLTSQGYMVGDYFSTSFVDGTPLPAFAVAFPPTDGSSSCAQATPNCDQPMFTAEGLSAARTASRHVARARATTLGHRLALRPGRPRVRRPTAR